MLYVIIILLLVAIVLWVMRVRHLKKLQKEKELINKLNPEVEAAFSDISYFFNYNHYITESERRSLESQYETLAMTVRPLLKSKAIESSPS